MNTTQCCWTHCLALAAGWWLVASVLLWLTWNHVITAFTKLKPAKIWQALLFVATMAVLCGPMRKGHHCMSSMAGHKADCPYSLKAK